MFVVKDRTMRSNSRHKKFWISLFEWINFVLLRENFHTPESAEIKFSPEISILSIPCDDFGIRCKMWFITITSEKTSCERNFSFNVQKNMCCGRLACWAPFSWVYKRIFVVFRIKQILKKFVEGFNSVLTGGKEMKIISVTSAETFFSHLLIFHSTCFKTLTVYYFKKATNIREKKSKPEKVN